jgi:hypothetical protein
MLREFKISLAWLARRVHLLQGSRGGKRWPALAAEAN